MYGVQGFWPGSESAVNIIVTYDKEFAIDIARRIRGVGSILFVCVRMLDSGWSDDIRYRTGLKVWE
jgi:hypothetical protein